MCRDAARGGRIIEVLPRKTLLARPLRSGSIRPVAANLDLAVLVVAPYPTTPLSFIDRCLVNLELQSLDSIIIFNKQDMGMGEAYEALQKIYQDAGYDTLACSAKSGQGLEELRARLAERASLMLGVSGAGKSSLARTLIPGADIAIGNLGGNGLHGAHTTSVSKLMDLPNGGVLVDTPGVRDFGTWQLDPTQVAFGFREFQPYLGECGIVIAATIKTPTAPLELHLRRGRSPCRGAKTTSKSCTAVMRQKHQSTTECDS